MILLWWALATQKDNPPPDLLICHHDAYCAVSNETPDVEDHCCKFSPQMGEAAANVIFSFIWEIVFQSHPVKFYDPRTCCTHESNKNHSTAQSELRLLKQSISSADCPEWCCCGQCQVTQKYHEQLCCRKKEGQCITTTYWFTQLVLSRDTLNKALLYEDPFLDLTGHSSNSQLRRIAYKQYIHWRFGSFELEDRAVIPSCCRRLIRNSYPKANGNYTGFNLE